MDASSGSNGRRAMRQKAVDSNHHSDDEDDDNPNGNTSPVKSPARRRGSIEDKVKRRSIMEGLLSFQIPGHSSDVSEDLLSDSDSENDDDESDQENTSENPPDNISSAVKAQHQSQYPPKTSRHVPQQQRAEQKRPRRSSFRSENSNNDSNNNSPFNSSKSVRFQVGDDQRIVKAGELSSHNKSLSLESVFALEDRDQSVNIGAEANDEFVVDSEKSSSRRSKDKNKQARAELQQKKSRMRKRSSHSKSADQQQQEEDDGMDQSNKSHNSRGSRKNTGMDQSHNSQNSRNSRNQAGMDQSYNSQNSRGSRNQAGMDQSHNSHKSQGSYNSLSGGRNTGMDQSHNSHKSQNSRASNNGEERIEGRRSRNLESNGKSVRSSSRSKHKRSSSRNRTQSSRKSSSSRGGGAATQEIASSKKSSRKSSRSYREEEDFHGNDVDEPVDRRTLLAKNSSLSELEEVSPKRNARRRHSNSKLELHEQQQQQQQPYRSHSLRSLGSVKERLGRKDATGVQIIDVGKVHKKEARRTSGTTGTETASESTSSKTKKPGSQRKLGVTREATGHRRTAIDDDGTEESPPNNMDNSNSNSINGGTKRRGIPRGSSRSSLEASEGAGRETNRTKQSKSRKSQSRLQMHKSLGDIRATQTRPDESKRREQSPSRRRSRSEHRRTVDLDTRDTRPIATSSFHEDRARRRATKQSSSRSLGKKTETPRRKGSYHSRMFVHEGLRSGEDDPVEENVNIPISDRDQRTGTSNRRRKSKKKVTPSHDTATTAATSTTMLPIVPDEEKTPVLSFSPKQNRRLLRNSSLNDMSLPFFDDDDFDDNDDDDLNNSGRRPLEKRQHKSLRHVQGEPLVHLESDDNDRGRSTVERGKDRRRQPSTERGKSRRSETRNERVDESGQAKPRRARSSSRHRQKRSSSRNHKTERERSRSRSRSRSKTRARSRSRQHRNNKVTKEESNEPQQAPIVVDINLPADIVVDFNAPGREGGPDGECFSSIEGVSVELDRQKEEKKKAKAAAKDAKTALKKQRAGTKDFNPSNSKLGIDGEKYDRTGEEASSPSFSPVLGERPVLLRADSEISSIGFPDRKKRPPSRVPLDDDLQIPDSIVLGATEGEFMAIYPPAGQTTVVSQSPATKRQSSSEVEEPLTGSHIMISSPSAIEDDLSESYYEEDEKEKLEPRWMSRLSTHALINVGMVDEAAKKASEHGGKNLLHGITQQSNRNSQDDDDDGEYSDYSYGDASFE